VVTDRHNALRDEIANASVGPGGAVRATLIRSATSARSGGVLRHRATNGLEAPRFRSLRVVNVEIDHMELVKSGAPAGAELPVAVLLSHRPGT
jgi:hypothetical protein